MEAMNIPHSANRNKPFEGAATKDCRDFCLPGKGVDTGGIGPLANPFFCCYSFIMNHLHRTFLSCCLALALICVFIPGFLMADEIRMELGNIETEDIVVRFEKPLAGAAEELARVYPVVKVELEGALNRKVNFRPVVIVIKDGGMFTRIAGNEMIVAFAVPEQSLIVIDYSKMGVRPFTLRETLKHELCHLLLHSRIQTGLPKWFDEGLAQWVTDGLANIVMDRKEASLNEAVIFHRLPALATLTNRFPAERGQLILAYEESRSMTEYIGKSFGKGKIYRILDNMEHGQSFESAVQEVLSMPLTRVEENWRRDLGEHSSWYLLIANNLYEIIFVFMALITIYAFIAITIRRWNRARLEAGSEDETE